MMNYIMEKHSKSLELDKVLALLSNEAFLKSSKEELLNISPQTNIKKIENALKETEAAFYLLARFKAPPLSNTPDVSSALKRADIGASLSIKDLIDVNSLLKTIRQVKAWRDNCDGSKTTVIDYYFEGLTVNKYLVEKIDSVIKSEDEIYDRASAELYNIRRQISAKSSKLRENLDKTIKGPLSKYLQDSIVTQRDGRFVVPVKIEYRSEIKGIVHDTSATGQTIFIEPMSVVEANNDIRVLKSKEAEEISRLLAELSSNVSEFSDSIRNSYLSLCGIDIVFAKAKLAYKMDANVPKVNSNGYINLIKARHPLIDKKTVVPIDINIGKEYNTLVITGPNTGGKTVSLKTVGIMCLMTMCGLMIPAAEGSEIAVFDKIFADIGDEQSIELSLSTFSSHMVNIISILNECDDNSLVLLDELCAGTDPVEGAALAKAILIHLNTYGAKTIVTTHYPELKIYALDTPYVKNASCEFDINTLKPTYRLIIGTPGRSNAFAISKRLGLGDDIVTLANEQVSEDEKRFERVVSGLEKARQNAEEREQKAFLLEKEIKEAKIKSDTLLENAQKEKLKILEETKKQALDIIENARYKSGEILNELETIKKSLSKDNADSKIAKARSLYKNSLNELEDKSDVVSDFATGEKLKDLPKSGDTVLIASLGSEATVISVNEEKKKVYVAIGSIKTWIDFDDLRVKNKQKRKKQSERTVTGIKSVKDRTVTGEVDLRGFASDEAIMELERYLDEAILTGINVVTIIHGKGTGTLGKAVANHLKHNKAIKSYRLGTFGEGESGVTIAELK